MVWWFTGLLALLAPAVTVSLPWSVAVRWSTTEGISLQLKFLRRAVVLTVLKGFGVQARVVLLGLKFNLATGAGGNKKTGGSELRSEQTAPPGDRLARWADRLSNAVKAVTVDSCLVLAGYLRGIIKSTETRLEISGEIGLGDPAFTGIVYGMVYGLLGAYKIGKIDLRPNFFDMVADGQVKLTVEVIPLVVLIRSLKAAFHPDIRKVWFALIAPRRPGIIKEVHNIGS
ncbi:MAG: DUF2953 domain-containing protein [Eubacteriales bacterium]